MLRDPITIIDMGITNTGDHAVTQASGHRLPQQWHKPHHLLGNKTYTKFLEYQCHQLLGDQLADQLAANTARSGERKLRMLASLGDGRNTRSSDSASRLMVPLPTTTVSTVSSTMARLLMTPCLTSNAAAAQRTGKSVEEIDQALDRDTWLDAEEAKAFGLVDQVFESRPAAEGEEAAKD